MKNKIQYEYLQPIGDYGILYLEESGTYGKTHKVRGISVQCSCGKIFRARHSDIVQNKIKACGHLRGNKAIVYKEGSYINNIKFIKFAGVKKYKSYGIFECPVCKNHWTASIINIKTGIIKSCCKISLGWSRKKWIKFCKTATFYKILVYNENEKFIKIGITSTTVNKRFINFPYNFKILKEVCGESGYIFDLEARFKRLFKKYKYKPLISFCGQTECFNIN